MSKANLMLALNEALINARKRVDICFLQVKYLLLGSVSALFTEITIAGLLILQLSNLYTYPSRKDR